MLWCAQKIIARITPAHFALLLLIFLFAPAAFTQNLKQESVTFQNGEVRLSGTLFLPDKSGQVPAVVILHGSGPDEGSEYKIYAENFAKAGIATLIFDKRGSGKSGGDWRKKPFESMANDALAAVEFLRNRSEINARQIGLWGISQGVWTCAFAAARSANVAFVVAVGGNAVSPAQQEIWHKDQMYRKVRYSETSRDTARKFWQMVFDWLVLVDEGKFPLPENVLESERAGGSIGLNYDSLPDWEKIRQPVLLMHGELDRLSPAAESISRISAALAKNGNNNFTYKIFPQASHTITTAKTGLEFDWDEHFAPGYFKFTTDWILANTNRETAAPEGDTQKIASSTDFDETGSFGKTPFYGRAYPQLILMILFPVIFSIGSVIAIIEFLRNKTFVSAVSGLLCLLNLLLLSGFYTFLATSIFQPGMTLMQIYSIPLWQRFLPVLGIISLVLTVILPILIFRYRRNLKKRQIFTIVSATLFVLWLHFWNLIGLPF